MSERAVSFPATNATNPEWEEEEYNSMELDYNASLHEKDVVLGVDVYNNEYKDIVIGTGHINISKVIHKDTRGNVSRVWQLFRIMTALLT